MSDGKRHILIGLAGGEHLALEVPEVLSEASDWVGVTVEFRSGAFAGKFRCNVMVSELYELDRALPRVKRDLVDYAWGNAEGNIALKLIPERHGAITAEVALSDEPAWRKFSFELALDQSYLPG